eukprot:gene4151-2993_t
MSNDLGETPLEEEGGEFINLDDPNLEILDDAEDQDAPEEVSDDDQGASGSPADGEEAEQDAPEGAAAEEDLNAIPDHEPSREDAFAVFEDPKHKPLHAIAAHPTDAGLFAVAGEGEAVYILRVPAPTARGESEEDEARQALQAALVQTLVGYTDTVSLVSFSPNGKWLATGSLDSTVALWSTQTWERVHSFSDLYGEILSLLWHPSSLLLVASCDDAQAAMWNVEKGTVVTFFAGHRDAVTTTLWSGDVKRLLTGSSDGSISVFNPKTGAQEMSVAKDLSGDNAAVTAMCVVGSEQCVVGCEDGTLHVVALRSGKVVLHLEEVHEQAIESIQYNPSLNLLVTSSCDCKVNVWSASDFTLRTTFNAGESVIPCIWLDSFVVAGCSDAQLRIWDGRSPCQDPLRVLDGHRRMILQMAAAGQVVGSVSDDGSARFFLLPEEA